MALNRRRELLDFEDRLARKIAREGEDRQRRMLREAFGGYSTWSDRDKRRNNVALAWSVAAFLLLIAAMAFHWY